MTEPSPVLVAQWAACGIAAAAARFVPVPMLDDLIRERAAQVAVSRTLRAHGRDYSSDRVEPLWEVRDPSRRLGRLFGGAALKVLLFPIRKYRALFGAVHGVPVDMMRVLLLARTVDRRLDRGELADPDPEQLAAQARTIRRAADDAMDGMDLRMLTAALSDGLSHGRGLSSAAASYARRWFTRPGTDPDLRPGGEVSAGAQRVTAVLRRPEIAQLLDRFDAQVDSRLAAVA
jgi:hypothetical protein